VASRSRTQALAACRRILPPLIRLLIGLGISAPEFASTCRRIYVQAAADRLAQHAKRISKSRIAIVTGLTRAEVTKLLKPGAQRETVLHARLHRAERVLHGWRTDPEFVSRNKRPRELPLKGRHRSFEALVKRYSGDIPPRAMLDELRAMSAARKQRNGSICMNARREVSPVRARDIAALGNQARALLDTLCHNLENPTNSIFAGTVSTRSVDLRMMELLLQRIEKQGRQFLVQIDDQFKHPPGALRAPKSVRSQKLAVTVFAHRETLASRHKNDG
jgi:hypothetical protein